MATNQKQRIEVVISGPVSCGKSTLAYLIADKLSSLGVDVKNDDEDVGHLYDTFGFMDRRVDSLVNGATVVINTSLQQHISSFAYLGNPGQVVVSFNGRLYVSSLPSDVEDGDSVWIRRIDRDGDRISVALAGSNVWSEWDAIDT